MIPWLLRTVITPAWAAYERSPYYRVSRELAARNHISLDERLDLQWRRLRGMVRHAWDRTPYYRRTLESVGFEPGDLRSWSDLPAIPILTKQAIREHRDEMVDRTLGPEALIPRKTSGSTGTSLEFFTDTAGGERKRGTVLYRDEWTGWRPGEYRAMVWGNPPPVHTLRERLRSAILERMFFLDTLRMDEGMMQAFAMETLRRKPTLMFGHAHSLFLFARFWKEAGLPPYRFKGVISTAMMLHSHERAGIESTFQSRVFDRYGCEEVSLIASECEAHTGLHINTDSLVVEVLDDEGGEIGGRVVVTDLWNRAMPFLRYEVGDRATLSPLACPCGRSYPLLEKVTGRVADYLLTPDGELVSGISLTENFATLIPGVVQVQLVQDLPTHVLVRIVPSPEFTETSRRKISAMVAERFGDAMTHEIETVERIPQERSGKYRFSICRVPAEEQERLRSSRRNATAPRR